MFWTALPPCCPAIGHGLPPLLGHGAYGGLQSQLQGFGGGGPFRRWHVAPRGCDGRIVEHTQGRYGRSNSAGFAVVT